MAPNCSWNWHLSIFRHAKPKNFPNGDEFHQKFRLLLISQSLERVDSSTATCVQIYTSISSLNQYNDHSTSPTQRFIDDSLNNSLTRSHLSMILSTSLLIGFPFPQYPNRLIEYNNEPSKCYITYQNWLTPHQPKQ